MESGLDKFIDSVLTLAGAEYAWLDEETVRVKSCPALCDLFGGAATLELALTEAALQERPTATPCMPGSFALDRLIQRVRDEPAAFAAALDPAACGEPEGSPPAANAETRLLQARSGERRALYVLFRISLHSDELVEQLAPVMVDERGRFRPDLVPAVQGANRKPDTVDHPLSPELLDALERAGERMALEAAAGVRAAVEERKGREISRLEGYLRALRDELHAELPAGPARRAAAVHAQTRSLLEALELLLPEEGPWERNAARTRLEPRPFRPFWKKAPTPCPVPPELAYQLSYLLGRLPEQFGRSEMEALIQDDANQQLQRLERSAKGNGSPAEALAERERQLEAEHQARIADIEEKYHLRIRVTPLLLEQVSYPMRQVRVGFAGCETLTAELAWDGLAGRWDPEPCPACREDPTALWVCEREHLACDRCARVCRDCRRARCPACGMAGCSVCDQPSCEGCGFQCEACDTWNCGQHGLWCPECEKVACNRCGAACHACERALCPEHHAACTQCQRPACADHSLRCDHCGQDTCPEHGERCPECTLPFCAEHSRECAHCGLTYCLACAGDGSRCATCRRLEAVGPATLEALRARVAESAPEAAGLGGWQLARSSRYLIVTARRWPRTYLFVLREEPRELVRSRKWFSFWG